MTVTLPTERIELPITGMTCASCANRVERKLNKLDGVAASVNNATETATVEFDPQVEVDQLVGAVEDAGYGAVLPAAETEGGAEPAEHDPAGALRLRLVVSGLLSVPVLLISMISALQFDNWQWLVLNLTTPVILWGAWPFHRAAWLNLRHATATMDTLISVGTLSAWLWSLYALFLGDAGMNEMRMEFNLIPSSGGGANEIYLETAAIVTTFILAGRYFESRAKGRAGAALKALLELVDGHTALGPRLVEDGDVLGAELEERLQRGAGAALGAGLEIPSGEDEGGDDGGRLEVDLVGAAA